MQTSIITHAWAPITEWTPVDVWTGAQARQRLEWEIISRCHGLDSVLDRLCIPLVCYAFDPTAVVVLTSTVDSSSCHHEETMSNPNDKSSGSPAPVLSASDRMARESVDRLLGRVSVEQRQKLAFDWADRAVRGHAPCVLEAAGYDNHANTLKALSPAKDEASGRAMKDACQRAYQALEQVRQKEEAARGGAVDENAPSVRAARVLSFAVESIKAALGEAGLTARVVSGNSGPTQIKKEPVDVGVQRAVLAGKYASSTARMVDESLASIEEDQQKAELIALLKAPKKFEM